MDSAAVAARLAFVTFDEPTIDVRFDDWPDEAGTGRIPIARGTTGEVIEVVIRPAFGDDAGLAVRGYVDAWDGDEPITHVEQGPAQQ